MADAARGPILEEPLSQRASRYGRWLGVELGAAVGISLLVWWLSDLVWLSSLGWSLLGMGTISLFAGGMAGGGFVNAGNYGVLYGRRHHQGWASTVGDIGRAQDLRDRLADRLRPRRNPTAFWQVLGGMLLLGLGILALTLAGS